MAVYMLNISIDASDVTAFNAVEDLSINDQESVIELLVEKVLGFENFIAEYDDPDSDQSLKKHNTKDFSFQKTTATCFIVERLITSLPNSSDSGLPLNGYENPESPPPKV